MISSINATQTLKRNYNSQPAVTNSTSPVALSPQTFPVYQAPIYYYPPMPPQFNPYRQGIEFAHGVDSQMSTCASLENNIKEINAHPEKIKEELKNNTEYLKLQNSKYFSTEEGKNALTLKIKDLKAGILQSEIDYRLNRGFGIAPNLNYLSEAASKLNITKCLYNVNRVLENDKISENTKNFVIQKMSNTTYQVENLEPLDNMDKNNIQALDLKLTFIPMYL